MPRALLTLTIAIALAAPIFAAATGTGTPTFAQTTIAAAQSGEPGITVFKGTTPWTILIHDPTCGSGVWRSMDGGSSWRGPRCTATNPGKGNGGDADAAFDDIGNLYVTDLTGKGCALKTSIPVTTMLAPYSLNTNFGTRWNYSVEVAPNSPCGSIAWDRQWIAAKGDGHVLVTARAGGQYAAWVSTDRAVTFAGPITIASGVSKGGAPFFAPDGTAYVPFCAGGTVRLAKSTDGGLTWTNRQVGTYSGVCTIFPMSDRDTGGNLYTVWADGTGQILGAGPSQRSSVYFSASTDGGQTWTPRLRVSDPAKNAVFPWIVAGAAGKVNVVFYQMNGVGSVNVYPDIGSPTTTWDVVMVQSLNANVPNPTFTPIVAFPTFHTGSVCTGGLSCANQVINAPTPLDRSVLDFFEVGADQDGNALIIHTLDRPTTSSPTTSVDLVLSRQVGGTTIG